MNAMIPFRCSAIFYHATGVVIEATIKLGC